MTPGLGNCYVVLFLCVSLIWSVVFVMSRLSFINLMILYILTVLLCGVVP